MLSETIMAQIETICRETRLSLDQPRSGRLTTELITLRRTLIPVVGHEDFDIRLDWRDRKLLFQARHEGAVVDRFRIDLNGDAETTFVNGGRR